MDADDPAGLSFSGRLCPELGERVRHTVRESRLELGDAAEHRGLELERRLPTTSEALPGFPERASDLLLYLVAGAGFEPATFGL
jgi:hypothetical protein